MVAAIAVGEPTPGLWYLDEIDLFYGTALSGFALLLGYPPFKLLRVCGIDIASRNEQFRERSPASMKRNP